MALPVIACAGREQRVKSRLPSSKRTRSDDIRYWFAERSELGGSLFAFLQVANEAHSEDKNFAAVPFCRQEGQRRRLAHNDPAGELVRRRLKGAAIASQ